MPRVLSSFDICESGTHAHDSSPDTTTVKSMVAPKEAVACFLTVETNAARVTIDGTDPTAGEYMVLQKDSAPFFLPIGHPQTIKWVSSVAAASVVRATWLR